MNPFLTRSLLASLLSIHALSARTLDVSSPSELQKAAESATPGDEIVIADGTWTNASIQFLAHGSSEQPILIHPKTPGGLTLTGESHFRMGGDHIVVSGVRFVDIVNESDWCDFRYDSKKPASNCRMTDCVFIESDTLDSGTKEARWVGIYGEQNEFDHCRIEGKKSKGTAVVVWLEEGVGAGHRLHHNHWYRRERLGKNGGEALRIGDSKSSLMDARCLIEDNIFQACNGEVECISNKSCENLYRRNLFLETQGTLTLRHGHRCVVEDNVFLGNGLKHTGGIRIIGEDHVVRGNHLQDLDGEEARGAIVFQNGIPDTPMNGYSPVRGALVTHNQVIHCRESLVVGYQDKDAHDAVVAPAGCKIEGNLFIAADSRPVVVETHAPLEFSWSENQAYGSSLGMAQVAGITFESALPSSAPPTPSLEPWSTAGPSWMAQGPVATYPLTK